MSWWPRTPRLNTMAKWQLNQLMIGSLRWLHPPLMISTSPQFKKWKNKISRSSLLFRRLTSSFFLQLRDYASLASLSSIYNPMQPSSNCTSRAERSQLCIIHQSTLSCSLMRFSIGPDPPWCLWVDLSSHFTSIPKKILTRYWSFSTTRTRKDNRLIKF